MQLWYRMKQLSNTRPSVIPIGGKYQTWKFIGSISSIVPKSQMIRPGFQVSAAPSIYIGTGRTGAPQRVLLPPEPPTLLDGAAKVTEVGNLGLIALLKILWNFGWRNKKVFSEHFIKKGRPVLLVEGN